MIGQIRPVVLLKTNTKQTTLPQGDATNTISLQLGGAGARQDR